MGAKAAPPAAPGSAQKRKPIVLDDSDNEDGNRANGSKASKVKPSPADTSKSKKRRVIYSSDEDEPETSKEKSSTVSSKVAKLKAVDVSNAFGSGPIKRVEKEKKSKKSLDVDVFDADTDDMDLLSVDELVLSPKAKKADKKEIKVKEEITSPTKDKPVLKSKNNKTPEKVKSEKKTPEKPKADVKKEAHTPDDSKEKSAKKRETSDGHSSKKKNENSSSSKKKPKKEATEEEIVDHNQSDIDMDQEKHEKRRAAAMLYKQFQKRAGPSAPGSKEIPKGKPNCLAGLAFVLTGVFESMERDEAGAVIKSLGGRVTSALSGKTNYIVAGEDSGPAKLAKAEELNIQILSEDDLLDLIREKSDMPTLNKKFKEEVKSPQKEKKSPNEKKQKDDKTSKRAHSPAKKDSPKKVKVEETNAKSDGILL